MSACLSVYQLCLLLCLSFYSICLWVLSFNFHLHPSPSLSIFPILSSALPLDRNMQQTVVRFHPSKSTSTLTSTSTSSSYSFFFTNRVTHSMFDICVKSNSFFCGMFLLPIFEFINRMSFCINFTFSNQTASLYRMYLELSNTLVAFYPFLLFDSYDVSVSVIALAKKGQIHCSDNWRSDFLNYNFWSKFFFLNIQKKIIAMCIIKRLKSYLH